MRPHPANPGRAAVAVVPGVADVLHIDGIKHSPPRMPVVVAFNDILATEVEIAVAQDEACTAKISDNFDGRV